MNALIKLKELSLDDKLTLLTGYDGLGAVKLEEKGILGLRMADGPYGVKTETGESVCYPNTCLMASSWSEDICRTIGEMLGDDCNRLGIDILLSPAINIKRNPLGGRNFEYYSEDPLVTGRLATQYINGIKSKGVGVCAKHFACNAQEENRWLYNSVLNDDVLRNIYLRAFEMVITNCQVDSIMAAYNRLNGKYCCENEYLLKDILRKEWDYDGVVVSDWCAISDIVESFVNGLDLEMPANPKITLPILREAYKKGALTIEEINKKVLRLLKLYYRLKDRKLSAPANALDDKKAKILRKLTGESLVLLKNQAALPLDVKEKILVVGNGAVEPRFQGGGCAKMKTNYVEIPFDEIKKLCSGASYASLDKIDEIDVRAYDKIVYFMTLPIECDSESIDRKTLSFPKEQIDGLYKLAEKHGKIIAVLQNGSVVDLSFEDKVCAILETYYSGSFGGGAVADALFGVTNPCGKLVETFYKDLRSIPYDCFEKEGNIVYAENEFLGYRYCQTFDKGLARYPFGYGLSYSDIVIENTKIERASEYEFNATCCLYNNSRVDGKQVVQVYLKSFSKTEPRLELIGFDRVSVNAGERKQLKIKLTEQDFYKYRGGQKVLISGEYAICIATSANDIIYEERFVFEDKEKLPFSVQTPLGALLTEPRYRAVTLKYTLKAILEWAYGDNEKGFTIEDIEKDAFLCNSVYHMPIRSFTYLPNGDLDLENERRLIEELNGL